MKDLNEVHDFHLADYFLHLDKIGLIYNEWVSIRTALRIPLIPVNDSDILLSQTLKLVLKGIKASKPNSRPNPVCWSLPLALEMLRSDFFTPLHILSEEALLGKALFFPAIATGKRASELGALDFTNHMVRSQIKTKFAKLSTRILAKNNSLQSFHSNIIFRRHIFNCF